jgi:hypothetical protein
MIFSGRCDNEVTSNGRRLMAIVVKIGNIIQNFKGRTFFRTFLWAGIA